MIEQQQAHERLRLSRAAVCVAVVTALLSACSAGAERSAAPPAEPSAPTAAAAPAPSGAAAPSTAATVRTLAFSYAGGQVTGDTGRQSVRLGEQVVLRITSDVAEDVHVHGYDVSRAVPAGGTVEVELTASIPGGFEVELHEAGTALCQLRVA